MVTMYRGVTSGPPGLEGSAHIAEMTKVARTSHFSIFYLNEAFEAFLGPFYNSLKTPVVEKVGAFSREIHAFDISSRNVTYVILVQTI